VTNKAGVAAALTVGLAFILTTTSRLFPSNFHIRWPGGESDRVSTDICTSNAAVSVLTVTF